MSAAETIILIILTAALIGAVVEGIRMWLHDPELDELEAQENTND